MKPCVVLSNPHTQCATLYWPDKPDYHVGYRFMEHDPETTEAPLPGIDDQPSFGWGPTPEPAADPADGERYSGIEPWGKHWAASYDEQNAEDPRQLHFRAYSDGSACARGLDNGGEQEREFFFLPVEDGLRMWMTLKTHVSAVGSLAVQQCLRFSGETAEKWRLPIARIPSLSEFDVQARGNPGATLTYARRSGEWVQFPLPYVRYHTPGDRSSLADQTSGVVDHGLIVRESPDGKVSSGMYWERTAYVSNRHPADCLHAAVDFGPLEAGRSRTLRGRFFFVDGTRNAILEIFQREVEGS